MSRPRQSTPRAGSRGGVPLRLGAADLRTRAWWIAAGYAVFATLWIYFSDRALGLLVRDPEQQARWSVYKGIGFVAITAILLFLFIRRAFATIETGYALYQAKAEQLRGSEAHLDAVFRTAMDAIMVVDVAGRVVLFNAAAERMFHCSADEAVARSLEEFLPDHLSLSNEGRHVLRGCRPGARSFRSRPRFP